MKFTDEECNLIIQVYVDVLENRINKYDGLKRLHEKKVKVSQNSYYRLLGNLEVLQILHRRNVHPETVEIISKEMKVYYIWKMYMQNK